MNILILTCITWFIIISMFSYVNIELLLACENDKEIENLTETFAGQIIFIIVGICINILVYMAIFETLSSIMETLT